MIKLALIILSVTKTSEGLKDHNIKRHKLTSVHIYLGGYIYTIYHLTVQEVGQILTRKKTVNYQLYI
jgi:hypothetical protein